MNELLRTGTVNALVTLAFPVPTTGPGKEKVLNRFLWNG